MEPTTDTTFKTVKEAARFLTAQFEARQDRGDRQFLKEDAPEWCTDAIQDGNDCNLNLDLAYELTEFAADWISERDDVREASDLFDHDSPDGDIYNGECLQWLASDNDHITLVDEVSDEYDLKGELVKCIQIAQARQREQVILSTWEWLKENVVDDTDDDDTDDDE